MGALSVRGDGQKANPSRSRQEGGGGVRKSRVGLKWHCSRQGPNSKPASGYAVVCLACVGMASRNGAGNNSASWRRESPLLHLGRR